MSEHILIKLTILNLNFYNLFFVTNYLTHHIHIWWVLFSIMTKENKM